jgi:hypothetical protein
MTIVRRAAFTLTMGAAACSIGRSNAYPIDGPARAAEDVPAQFALESGEIRNETSGSPACRNPMIDPRDGTSLRLIASQDGIGDYRPPPGKYGVGPLEVLRLECGTGKVIGIVPAPR